MAEEEVVKARIDKHGSGKKVTVWTYDGKKVRAHVKVFEDGDNEGRQRFVKDPIGESAKG
jgi:hypothetical protein